MTKKTDSKAKAAPTSAKRTRTQGPRVKARNGLLSGAPNGQAGRRRRSGNPAVPMEYVNTLSGVLSEIKTRLEGYAAHLRALDRRRLNGVGIKKQGFIERAFALTVENPEFLPHYLTLGKFREDGKYFTGIRSLLDLSRQIEELLWNIAIEASDVWYTDALEFYASAREAAKRRVDAAESVHNELAVFFKSRGTSTRQDKI
jgi:hypothetical protein